MRNSTINFLYCVQYNSETDTSNCECEGMCRCRKIKNCKIESVDIKSITEKIREHCKMQKEDLYFIERIVVYYKLYDVSKYDCEIGNGYYGEEVNGIFIDDEALLKTVNEFKQLKKLNDKIFFVLKLEYSFIPKQYKLDFKKGTISKDELITPNEMVRRENIYSDYDVEYPLGIVRRASKSQYQIIDGNHRIMNNKNGDVNGDILVYIGEG